MRKSARSPNATRSAARQIVAALRQPPAGELEGGISAQIIEIVGIRIATGNREDAGTQDVCQRMRHAPWIALIGDHSGQCCSETKLSVRTGQQQHAAI